ncbi:MAG: glycosyl hydrolase 108 family protein [Cytophagales bacterium]
MSAKFEIAHKNSQQHEGGYVSPEVAASIRDAGGETYRGYARNAHPNSEVWKIIDDYKKTHSSMQRYNGVSYFGLKHGSYILNTRLNQLIDAAYKKEYWDAINLGKLKNQSVANFLYDIHMGSTTGLIAAVKFLQDKLDLLADGKIGEKTIAAINKHMNKSLFEELKAFRKKWLERVPDSYEAVLMKRTDSFFFLEEKEPG